MTRLNRLARWCAQCTCGWRKVYVAVEPSDAEVLEAHPQTLGIERKIVLKPCDDPHVVQVGPC